MFNADRKSQELHLSTCIQLRMTKCPSRQVMNFRHLLGCDTKIMSSRHLSLCKGNFYIIDEVFIANLLPAKAPGYTDAFSPGGAHVKILTGMLVLFFWV